MIIPIQRIGEHNLPLPEYKTANAAGMDLQSVSEVMIPAGGACIISTGFALAIPAHHEGQIRTRSSMAMYGVVVLNSPGTIDADYRGEIKVILMNINNAPFKVEAGQRVAQLVIAQVDRAELYETTLDDTSRGAGGFGSTGK